MLCHMEGSAGRAGDTHNHVSPFATASLNRSNEDGEQKNIGCPQAIHDYFYNARSVDVLSQLHYAYPIGRKASRCWPRLLWWLLDMCIVNAFQLWSIGKERPHQLGFRLQLMHELLKQLPSDHIPRQSGAGLHPLHALASEHFSIRAETERDCVVCSQQPKCRVSTRYVCVACHVHLCIGECFAEYHLHE